MPPLDDNSRVTNTWSYNELLGRYYDLQAQSQDILNRKNHILELFAAFAGYDFILTTSDNLLTAERLFVMTLLASIGKIPFTNFDQVEHIFYSWPRVTTPITGDLLLYEYEPFNKPIGLKVCLTRVLCLGLKEPLKGLGYDEKVTPNRFKADVQFIDEIPELIQIVRPTIRG